MEITAFKKIKTFLVFGLFGLLFSCDKEETRYNLPAYGPEQAFYALSTNNTITAYNAADVRSVGTKVNVTGLATAERLLDIDFRPATGDLYAVSSASKIYVINLTTGAATAISQTAFSPALEGTVTSIDFNPAADLLRVVTNRGQNLRISPITGQVVGTDVNVSSTDISGIGYNNNYAGATTTVLYDLDPVAGKLLRQTPPNDGILVAVGNLDVAIGSQVSFDISPDSKNALAVGKVGDSTKLYTIDLASGKATLAGKFIAKTDIKSIAMPTNPAAYAIDQAGNLLTFNPTLASPAIYSKPLTGLQTGESILGMDMRPLNGQLYALGSSNRLYTINIGTGALTQVGTGIFSTALSGTNFGFDFNPVTDLIRVVSDSRQSLEINPVTAAITVGTPITTATAQLSAVAFDNNFRSATATSLFVIDHSGDKLFTLAPTTGVLTAIGDLKLDVSGVNGFDISADNLGYAILAVGTKTNLYTISLISGTTTAKFEFPTAVSAFTLGLR